jgi:hypothetical protein
MSDNVAEAPEQHGYAVFVIRGWTKEKLAERITQRLDGIMPEEIVSINYHADGMILPFWRRNSAFDHDRRVMTYKVWRVTSASGTQRRTMSMAAASSSASTMTAIFPSGSSSGWCREPRQKTFASLSFRRASSGSSAMTCNVNMGMLEPISPEGDA